MTEFSALSYAALGVAYALLTILLLTSWRGRRTGTYLIVACATSAAWAGLLALQASNTYTHIPLLFLIEVLRGGMWVTFLVVVVSQVGVSRGIRLLSMALWLIVLLAGFVVLVSQPQFILNEMIRRVMIPGGLTIALLGLMLIEQLYRNSPQDARWEIRSLVIGLGGIFAYDLFLYSQAMLFGALDTNAWMARGAVNVLFIPLIVIAAKRNPQWDVDVFVSRHVVFYSTTLVAVGLYLLLTSLGGYALVLYEGSWGTLGQVVFFTGAFLVLVTLLFSSSLRSRVKVFLSKHFYRNKYDHREEWLRLVATLSEFENSSTRQVVIKAIAQIVGSPSGTLWILDEPARAYRVAASYNTDRIFPELRADEPIVAFMAEQSWLVDLDEYRLEPDLYQGVELPAWLLAAEAAWLLVPLITRQTLLGIILIDRGRVTVQLNYEDRDLLKTVGNHIAVHLAQDISDSLLTEARQFEAYNRLTSFLMHDLSNLVAQQSLIVENAEKHKRNPEFIDDTMNTIANSVDRMKRIMDQLRRRRRECREARVSLLSLIQKAVERSAVRQPVPILSAGATDGEINVDSDQFVSILEHLIKNAQEATADDGTVEIVADKDESKFRIAIRDTGGGMTPKFVRERLFRPFDSTKGSQGMGIGAYQAREFVRSIGGEILVEAELSVGTTVTLVLPRDHS